MPVPVKTGEVLRGRYKIRRVIGQGGVGCIYLADDLRLEGRTCALKEVEHDRTLPPDLLRERVSKTKVARRKNTTSINGMISMRAFFLPPAVLPPEDPAIGVLV